MISSFNEAKGVMTASSMKVLRGQVANSVEKKVDYIDPISQKLETFDEVKMETDLAVVDILGGMNVGRNAAKVAPGMLLLMDGEGNFEIREELTDRTAFASAKAGKKRIEDFKETGTLGSFPGGAAGGSPYGPTRPGASPYGPMGPMGPPGGGERRGGGGR
jgi:hypothetical protein